MSEIKKSPPEYTLTLDQRQQREKNKVCLFLHDYFRQHPKFSLSPEYSELYEEFFDKVIPVFHQRSIYLEEPTLPRNLERSVLLRKKVADLLALREQLRQKTAPLTQKEVDALRSTLIPTKKESKKGEKEVSLLNTYTEQQLITYAEQYLDSLYAVRPTREPVHKWVHAGRKYKEDPFLSLDANQALGGFFRAVHNVPLDEKGALQVAINDLKEKGVIPPEINFSEIPRHALLGHTAIKLLTALQAMEKAYSEALVALTPKKES